MRRKVAVVGANGVPASYGGWDQLVEHFSLIDDPSYEFVIYCSHLTNKNNLSRHNRALVRSLPLNANGWQSVPYDIYSLFFARRECDLVIMLGCSGALAIPFFRLLGQKIILNIDGVEWKRSKWNVLVRCFLWASEYVGVKTASKVVTDNEMLSNYVIGKYHFKPFIIAYGGDHVEKVASGSFLESLCVSPKGYACKVCRIVPENNIELILDAVSETSVIFLLVGNFKNSKYGLSILKAYGRFNNIKLIDPIYDQQKLDEIRTNAGLYIHGHSVGGTNPSLVEAMFLGLNIAAFDVSYNRATTSNNALFFDSRESLRSILLQFERGELVENGTNLKTVATYRYKWDFIMSSYLHLLDDL